MSFTLLFAWSPRNQYDVFLVDPKWLVRVKAHGGFVTPDIMYLWHGDVHKRGKTGQILDKGDKRTVRNKCRFQQNEELAAVFRKLSNLHQSSPLLETDQWKAYMFRVIAGRLLNLDFEIRNEPGILARLNKIPGIGINSVKKMKEYMETGTTSRIEEFKTDERRVAMKNMMAIWGVGRVKVRGRFSHWAECSNGG